MSTLYTVSFTRPESDEVVTRGFDTEAQVRGYVLGLQTNPTITDVKVIKNLSYGFTDWAKGIVNG